MTLYSPSYDTAKKICGIIGVAGFILILLIWAFLEYADHRYLESARPSGILNYEEWRAHFGPPAKSKVTRFKYQNITYFLVSADLPIGWASPLGISYYVFDRDGFLKDWVADAGRDANFYLKWQINNPTEMTDSAFRRLLRAR